MSLVLAACGGDFDGDGGGPLTAVDVSQPATSPLLIPELLEPKRAKGVASYDLSIAPSHHDFGSGVEAETLSYNGASVLGPTLRWRKGDSVEIDVTSELDETTTTHWHGADVPAQADGGPHSMIKPGETWTAKFDVIQPAATLWYHPHLMGTTAEQVFAGAAGMIIVDDDNRAARTLPKTYGVDDIPVIVQDREFDDNGELAFEIDDGDAGDLNPDLRVNGTENPYLEVPQGQVRLRLLNGSQARMYDFGVDSGQMTVIATDGGYLQSPVAVDSLAMGPGDRNEVIIEVGDEPVNLMDDAFGRVLEIRPTAGLTARDSVKTTSVPDQLTTIKKITADEIDNERTFVLDEVDGGWGINGKQMDMGRVDETIRLNDVERWTISSADGNHTWHVHQTLFQVLSIDGEPPPAHMSGWEDTVRVLDGQEVVIAARFNTYSDPDIPYMYHCHVLDHEDSGMMGQFVVVE